MTIHPRLAHAFAAVLLLPAATALAVLSGPAASAASSTTCAGTSAIAYNPGLTNTPRTVHYDETDTYSNCISTDTTLTAGSSATSIDIPGASCTNPPALLNDPAYTITWNNSQHSVIDLTFTDTIIAGIEQVTGIGTVISGEFTGATATIIWLYPLVNPLACLTSQGVTNQSGTLTAQIIGP